MAADLGPPYDIAVQMDEAFLADVDEELFVQAATAALLAEGRGPTELTIVLTDNDTIRTLNRTYAGLDEPTDVLSFSALEGTGFVPAPDADTYIGDIVIALPYAQQQAAQAGNPLAAELTLLTVHGVLHLLGYDHATATEQAQMWARQDAIIQSLRHRSHAPDSTT